MIMHAFAHTRGGGDHEREREVSRVIDLLQPTPCDAARADGERACLPPNSEQ